MALLSSHAQSSCLPSLPTHIHPTCVSGFWLQEHLQPLPFAAPHPSALCPLPSPSNCPPVPAGFAAETSPGPPASWPAPRRACAPRRSPSSAPGRSAGPAGPGCKGQQRSSRGPESVGGRGAGRIATWQACQGIGRSEQARQRQEQGTMRMRPQRPGSPAQELASGALRHQQVVHAAGPTGSSRVGGQLWTGSQGVHVHAAACLAGTPRTHALQACSTHCTHAPPPCIFVCGGSQRKVG